jgi:hypothetical protein
VTEPAGTAVAVSGGTGRSVAAGFAATGSRPGSPTARETLRRLRFPLAFVAFILIAGTAIAMLQPHSGPGYLDPHDPGPLGARALAQLLADRGQAVIRVSTPQQAAQVATADTTLVVTGAAFIRRSQLAALGQLPGDRFLVQPDAAMLEVLAPGLSLSPAGAGAGAAPVASAEPDCGLTAARLAGDAFVGGAALHATAAVAATAQQCYPLLDGPSLIQYATGGRTVTVLGTGMPLTNGSLADRGDAALTLNLLASRPTIVWLTPGVAALDGGTGQRTLASLVPWPAYLIMIQLAVTVVALALWRVRRLGPLVTEPLPVVVRAAETVEGHGRLYRSRRSRDQAAVALRGAAIGRLIPLLGLPAAAAPATIAATVTARAGRSAAAVQSALFGPVPATDADLVQLANDLDSLESEVRQP